jgi:glycosyltransferase involved in cell wall biosynthesis
MPVSRLLYPRSGDARIHIRAFYPADPLGTVPGGVDTFLRGLVKWAPEDLAFSIVGMSTDTAQRPIGQWTRWRTGTQFFDFFPVVAVRDPGRRSRVPLSLRYTAGLVRYLRHVRSEFDVFEFHRVEPAIVFIGDPRPKNAFFHQDMGVIRRERNADILWRYLPGLYFAVERHVVAGFSSAWCVRDEGVRAMRARYPSKADLIRFVPTWVDPELFSPPTADRRAQLRTECSRAFALDSTSVWVVSVGRLDTQKDPQLLLSAVGRLVAEGHDVQWLAVGDGVLRPQLEREVQRAGLGARVRWAGLRTPAEIAVILQAADVFALSSAYEGMPMAMLEALRSGLPVATTDVGEVRRVVQHGINGSIATERSIDAFAACLRDVVEHAREWRGEPAVKAVKCFLPKLVLTGVYDHYRDLGARWRAQQHR